MNRSTKMERFIRYTLGLSGYYFDVEVRPCALAKPKACFINCMKVKSGYTSVAAWIIYTRDDMNGILVYSGKDKDQSLTEGCFEAELHCILRRNRDGRYFDITPDICGMRRRRIVLEPRVDVQKLTDYIIRNGPIENEASPEFERLYPNPGTYLDFNKVLKDVSI